MIALMLERLDQRLRGERDVEVSLGAPCIGLVPRIAHAAKGSELQRLVLDAPFDPYTEAIRSIFAALIRPPTVRDRAQSLLMTSSCRGDGTTSLVVSLATYIAGLGRRVLVIDLDLRRPRLLHLLGEADTPGCGLRTAKHHGIDYFSLPQKLGDPLEMLTNGDFPALLARLQHTYDHILIDSAPAVGATETRLLASMVDGVVLTVRWGVTDAHTGLAAVQQLRDAGRDSATPISVVVSRVKMRAHERHRYSQPVAASTAPATAVA